MSPVTSHVVVLALLLASCLLGQQPSERARSFDELRARIERERSQPAAKRTTAISQLRNFREPNARDYALQLLASDKEVLVRNAVLDQLRFFPHADSLAVLQKEFQATSPKPADTTLRAAASGLSGQGKEGIQVLLQTLSDRRAERSSLRIAALQGLRFAGNDSDVFAALQSHLRSSNGTESAEAMRALGGQKNSAELNRLRVETLSHKDAKTRVEALYQLARNDQPGLTRPLEAQAADKKLLADRLERAKLFFICARILEPKLVPLLLRLGEPADGMIQSQIGYIAKSRDKTGAALLQFLTKACDSKRELDRFVALRLLCLWPNEDAQPAIRAALKDRSERIVLRAVQSLVQGANASSPTVIEPLLKHANENVRIAAMGALHSLGRNKKGQRGWGPALLVILRKGSAKEQLAALDLLAELGFEPALADAQARLENDAWPMRSAAIAFLAHVRDPSSVPLLIARLDYETGRLQHEILGALRGLTGKTYLQADHWRRWWEASAKTFRLAPVAKVDGQGTPPTAAITYYDLQLTSKRVCFVLDTSGSMAEKVGTAKVAKIEVAKKALQQVIDRCPADFHFNLVPFSSDAQRFMPQLIDASQPNKDKARGFTAGMRARGATNVYAALKMAFDNKDVDTIYLLSDGYPSAGEITNIQDLADVVREWNRSRRIIIHGISVGTDSLLLQRLAKESGGRYVRRM